MSEVPQQTQAPDFSPRAMGRILDRAFDIYRANFRTIATASFMVVFPFALAAGIGQVFYTRGAMVVLRDVFTNVAAEPDLASFTQMQVWAWLSNAASLPLLVARLYIASSLLHAASGMLYGDRPGVRELLRGGAKRFWPFLGISLILYMMSGFYILIVPLVFLAGWALAPAAVVVEQAPFDQAFRRSWTLTTGYKWRVVGFFLVIGVFTLVLETAVTSPTLVRQLVASFQNPGAVFEPLSAGWKVVEGAFSATALALVYPFVELAWFSFYVDMRSRREGMDLVAKASGLRREQ